MNPLTKKLLMALVIMAVALFVATIFSNKSPDILGPIIGFGGVLWIVLLLFIIVRSIYLRFPHKPSKISIEKIGVPTLVPTFMPTKKQWKDYLIPLLIFPIIPISMGYTIFKPFYLTSLSFEAELLSILGLPALHMLIAIFFCITGIKRLHREVDKKPIMAVFYYFFAIVYSLLGIVSLPALYFLALLARAAR